jgi:hypothetical protein
VALTSVGSAPTNERIMEMSWGAKLHKMSSSRRIFPKFKRLE